jgi:hypothetical protein
MLPWLPLLAVAAANEIEVFTDPGASRTTRQFPYPVLQLLDGVVGHLEDPARSLPQL